MHDQLEMGAGCSIELFAVENTLEKYCGGIDAGRTQHEAFVDPRHGKGIGRFFERARHGDEPVTVSIGLDDGHDARSRRPLPHRRQIVAESAGIHRRADHRGHGDLGSAARPSVTEIRLRRTTPARSSRTWCTRRGT